MLWQSPELTRSGCFFFITFVKSSSHDAVSFLQTSQQKVLKPFLFFSGLVLSVALSVVCDVLTGFWHNFSKTCCGSLQLLLEWLKWLKYYSIIMVLFFNFRKWGESSVQVQVLTMTEEEQNQLQSSGLEELKEKTAKLKGKESER